MSKRPEVNQYARYTVMNILKRFALVVFLAGVSLCTYSKEICPTGKDIMTSSTPYGYFAKSIWNMNRAKFNMRALHSSILIFSREKINAEDLDVEGYIWWRRRGKLADCSKFKGKYFPSEHKLELQIVEATGNDIPLNTRLNAVLSEDGLNLTGKMKVLKRSVNDNPEAAVATAGASNIWANTSQSQSGTWKAKKIFPLEEDKNNEGVTSTERKRG